MIGNNRTSQKDR